MSPEIVIKNRCCLNYHLEPGIILDEGKIKIQEIRGDLIFCEDNFGEVDCYSKSGKCLSNPQKQPLQLVERVSGLNMDQPVPESGRYSFPGITTLTVSEKGYLDGVSSVSVKTYLIQDLWIEFYRLMENDLSIQTGFYIYGRGIYQSVSSNVTAWNGTISRGEPIINPIPIAHFWIKNIKPKVIKVIVCPASKEVCSEYRNKILELIKQSYF